MGKINDVYSIIVPASGATFSAHTYTQVYAGANATPTINGIPVVMNAGTLLDVKVKTISSTANVYLLGENINVALGSINL